MMLREYGVLRLETGRTLKVLVGAALAKSGRCATVALVRCTGISIATTAGYLRTERCRILVAY
jgi:hypothetical protein